MQTQTIDTDYLVKSLLNKSLKTTLRFECGQLSITTSCRGAEYSIDLDSFVGDLQLISALTSRNTNPARDACSVCKHCFNCSMHFSYLISSDMRLCNFTLWDRCGPCSEVCILVVYDFNILDTLGSEILDFIVISSVCVSVSHIFN